MEKAITDEITIKCLYVSIGEMKISGLPKSLIEDDQILISDLKVLETQTFWTPPMFYN